MTQDAESHRSRRLAFPPVFSGDFAYHCPAFPLSRLAESMRRPNGIPGVAFGSRRSRHDTSPTLRHRDAHGLTRPSRTRWPTPPGADRFVRLLACCVGIQQDPVPCGIGRASPKLPHHPPNAAVCFAPTRKRHEGIGARSKTHRKPILALIGTKTGLLVRRSAGGVRWNFP